ncbi:minor tail protein [Shigella sonnei]|nr:minor tail protein [Shigella sonnei]SRK18003.1 minor tail protein [Shigella sonnei]SRX21326.1 minor tail protein [Shigella sonnei]
METFHWKVRPDMNVVSEPKVVTVKLGDGYEQRRAAGLNNQLSTYSVKIRVRKGEQKPFWNGTVASAHFSGRHLMTGSRSGWFVVNGRQAWGRCG